MAWNRNAENAPSPTPKRKPTAWRGAAALLKYPRSVKIIKLEMAPFRCAKDAVCWAKVTLKTYVDANEDTKAYSYEISNIEVLKGNAGDVPLPSDKTSMDARILLNGVCDVNGAPLLK